MSVIEENWNYEINYESEKQRWRELETNLTCVCTPILQSLEEFKVVSYSYSGTCLNQDDELRNIQEKNTQLRHDIDSKVSELAKQQSQYENLKHDQKLLSQEIKETHEAFLMAKKYYKKFLKLYYTIESQKLDKQTIYIQFFCEAKKEPENYSVRLIRDTNTKRYQLLETNPKLSILKELQRRLQETNDVPGALCCIRQTYLALKAKKTKRI